MWWRIEWGADWLVTNCGWQNGIGYRVENEQTWCVHLFSCPHSPHTQSSLSPSLIQNPLMFHGAYHGRMTLWSVFADDHHVEITKN